MMGKLKASGIVGYEFRKFDPFHGLKQVISKLKHRIVTIIQEQYFACLTKVMLKNTKNSFLYYFQAKVIKEEKINSDHIVLLLFTLVISYLCGAISFGFETINFQWEKTRSLTSACRRRPHVNKIFIARRNQHELCYMSNMGKS